jgi:single-strand DNA-binding protein
MAGYNRVILMGNLTTKPELRYTPQGTAVADLRMAVTLKRGKEKEETAFIDVVTWGKTAENCETYLDKGSSALIEGRITMDEWEDKESGKKRSKLKVTAETVQFLGSRKKRDGGRDKSASSEPPLDDFGDEGDVPF